MSTHYHIVRILIIEDGQKAMMDEDLNWQWKEGPIGRLIKVGFITLRREMQDLLKSSGLTQTQWSALGVIRHYPGITSSELEHILMIERPSVTSLMNGLSKKGFVIRKGDTADGRYKRIFLTETGLLMAEQTQHFANEVEKKVKGSMEESDFEMLKLLLIKMVDALEQK